MGRASGNGALRSRTELLIADGVTIRIVLGRIEFQISSAVPNADRADEPLNGNTRTLRRRRAKGLSNSFWCTK